MRYIAACLAALVLLVQPVCAAAESFSARALSLALAETIQKQAPKKIAFLAGGSCDGNKDNFTNEFIAWNRFLLQKDWLVFSFISADKQPYLKEEFGNMKPFKWDVFLQDLASAPLKRGDQLFITFISHGERENGIHGICDDSQKYNDVSALKNILAEFAQKGVKIGIFDQSCYGGSSVQQLDSHVYCVASSSQYNQTGSGAITGKLAERLPLYAKRNISLEDIWVMTLAASLKNLRQIPAISGLGSRNAKLLLSDVTTANGGIISLPSPSILVPSNRATRNPYIFSGQEQQESLAFIHDNQKLLQKFFPEEAIADAEEFFHQNKFFKVSDEAAVAVNYWLDNPDPSKRICAGFVF